MSLCAEMSKTARWAATTIANNFYNLSRPEFRQVRDAEASTANPALHKYYIHEFSRLGLLNCESIQWFNVYLDLVYVMVVFKVDDILVNCSQQKDRQHDISAAVNVYVVAISFFVLMFYTRYQMDHYSCSFMRLTKEKSYPLLQSDIFHRIIIVLYGLGTFLMTMNIVLAEVNENIIENADFFVGSCRFDKQYSTGFAIGFLMTRGLMILLYLCCLRLAQDPVLSHEYRGSFVYKIVRNVIGMIIVCVCFGSLQAQPLEVNRLNVVVLAFIAAWEVTNEFFLSSCNEIVRWWWRRQLAKQKLAGMNVEERNTTHDLTNYENEKYGQYHSEKYHGIRKYLIRTIEYETRENHDFEVDFEKVHDEGSKEKTLEGESHHDAEDESSLQLTSLKRNTTSNPMSAGIISEDSNREEVESDHDGGVNKATSKAETLKGQRPRKHAEKQPNHASYARTLRHHLYCDAEQLQDRLSLLFMLVLGESFLGLLYKNYDPNNSTSILVQFLVYLLLTSTGMQFFETVDKVVAPPEVHKKRRKPPALLSDVQAVPPSHIGKEDQVEPKTSYLRRLPPPPPPPPLQPPRSTAGNESIPSSVQESSPKPSKDIPSNSSTAGKASPTEKAGSKGTFLKSFKIPKTLLRKRPVHAHGILARYPYNHYFIWMHVIVSFTLLVATCGIIGLYFNSNLNLPAVNTHHKHKVPVTKAPTLAPTITIQVDIDDNRLSRHLGTPNPRLRHPAASNRIADESYDYDVYKSLTYDTSAFVSSSALASVENDVDIDILVDYATRDSQRPSPSPDLLVLQQENEEGEVNPVKIVSNDPNIDATKTREIPIPRPGQTTPKKPKTAKPAPFEEQDVPTNRIVRDKDVLGDAQDAATYGYYADGGNGSFVYAYDDLFYYYATGEVNVEEVPSLTLSQWQLAVGLFFTEIGCFCMRLLHSLNKTISRRKSYGKRKDEDKTKESGNDDDVSETSTTVASSHDLDSSSQRTISGMYANSSARLQRMMDALPAQVREKVIKQQQLLEIYDRKRDFILEIVYLIAAALHLSVYFIVRSVAAKSTQHSSSTNNNHHTTASSMYYHEHNHDHGSHSIIHQMTQFFVQVFADHLFSSVSSSSLEWTHHRMLRGGMSDVTGYSASSSASTSSSSGGITGDQTAFVSFASHALINIGVSTIYLLQKLVLVNAEQEVYAEEEEEDVVEMDEAGEEGEGEGEKE